MKRHRRMLAALCCFAVAVAAHPVAAAPTPDSSGSPVRGALSDTPWYDAESDSLRPVRVETETDDSANRASRWMPDAAKVKKKPPASGSSPSGGLFGTQLTIGNLIGWLLLIVLLAAIVGGLVYAFSRAEIELDRSGGNDLEALRRAPDEQTVERMKQLPAELRRTDVNLRSEAYRLMNEGRYDQAIILLFGHQLLLLDRGGLLRLSRGKTNGCYLRETRAADPESATPLRMTVASFERSYFGRHELSGDDFAEVWQANERLEQRLRARSEVAA